MAKKRLDLLLTERNIFPTRERARAAIMSGEVYVDGQRAEKPGTGFSETADIQVREKAVPYVSRGGLKLEKALDVFDIGVEGRSVLDGGASTGGFTDCLLRRGAAFVWAVDVGYGQLAWPLRNNPRVACIERFNIRNITRETLGGIPDMVTLDLSFISLALVLPVIRGILNDGADVVCLIKPQFEAGRDKVGKNGVVRDSKTHIEVLQTVLHGARNAGYAVKGITFSPIKGPKGNIEFTAHLTTGGEDSGTDICGCVDRAHKELV